MTEKEVRSIVFRGVERGKNPVLADDGGALESFNLRPTKDGLELVHDKERISQIVFPWDAGLVDKEVSLVFRHHALPEGCHVFVFGKRTVMVSTRDDSGNTSILKREDGAYFKMEYGEDILELGELNNVLVVRTATGQDFWLWSDGKYEKMPAVRMPDEMVLEQEFDKEAPESPSKNPFFGAVVGFFSGSSQTAFEKVFEANRDSALQFVQGIRAEEEAEQRKLGRFIGHVLVRCAFKTAQGNYTSYGPVLHAEIGAYSQSFKTANLPQNDNEESGLEWYGKIYRKLLRSPDGDSSGILVPDGERASGFGPLWPVNALVNAIDNTGILDMRITHDGILPNAGYSQPPVFVGAVPYSVWVNKTFRGYEISSTTRSGFNRLNSGSDNGAQAYIGVYAPGIVYSYPVLKFKFDQETLDALRYYEENGIVQSLCVAMTAPVKHGFGTKLVKVGTVPYGEMAKLNPVYYKDGDEKPYAAPLYDPAFPLVSDEGSEDRKNDDYLDVYGYQRSIDTDPERLMDKPFYIVKEIRLEELLRNYGTADTVYEIPLRLTGTDSGEADSGSADSGESDSGESDSGSTDSEESDSLEDVDDLQGVQLDPGSVTLENIENAEKLPTDNFSNHTIMGLSYLEYNHRLHMLGVENVLFEGYFPSPGIKRDEYGYGPNSVAGKPYTDGLYIETLIAEGSRQVLLRHPVGSYLCERLTSGQANQSRMVLPDILTYPDYRCKMMRIVLDEGGKRYNISGDMECKNSLLNNVAYVAFTGKGIPEETLYLSCSRGLTILGRILETDSNDSRPFDERNRVMVYDSYIYRNDTERGIPLGKYGYAYAPDDALWYYGKVLDIGKELSEYPEADYTGYETGGLLEDYNRVQVSETDDVFSYPSKNSYRFGSLDNRIIAANSVYGQVTEQKFGMFPLYVFTKEGIFTMEQGTGDILYQNVSKVNDDRLTGKWSICNAGDMIAYLVRDGLRLIQGKNVVRAAEQGDGRICIGLGASAGAFKGDVTEFADLLSLSGFNEEVQGSRFLYDSYNHEILMMCIPGAGKDRFATWAYSLDTSQLYKRSDVLNDTLLSGVIENDDNIAWMCDDYPSGAKIIQFYDFDSSDREYNSSAVQDKGKFLYVSNPIKVSDGVYKRVERSVLRCYGSGVTDMEVLYFGSLDGMKWFKMGGGKVTGKGELSGMTMRRIPCSVRYLIVLVKGEAAHVQISRLDAEVRMKYANRLR